MSEANTFLTNLQAQSNLKHISNNKNIIAEIEQFLKRWIFNTKYDLEVFNEDIDNIIKSIKNIYFNDDDTVIEALQCVIHNLLWDNLKPLIRAKYTEDDQMVHKKSKNKQTESSTYSCIPYTAAIVELSMLDSYNSPSEKLNCLCATYDIIFAEIKSALVTQISKYSEKDIEIPIINNEEVLPIILLVFKKSKLKHPFSSLMYIKLFGQNLLEDSNKRYILQTFENIIRNILNEDESLSLEKNTQYDIDYCEVINKMALRDQDVKSLQGENNTRLLQLIFTSTTYKM